MFCVACGREGKLYGSLCSDCFLSKNVFITLPKNKDVELCVHCGSRKKGKGWVKASEHTDILEEVIFESVKKSPEVEDFDIHLKPDYEDEKNVNVEVITHANVHDLKAEEEHKLRVRFKKTVCSECSRREGGYWEAKVQLRGDRKGLDNEDTERALDIVDFTMAEREKKDRDAFLTKMEKIHSGLDFYVGSNALGKAISKRLAVEFGANVKESAHLVGRRDGKDIYRMTYLVRLPAYRVDDFIQLDKEIFLVKKVTSEGAILQGMHNRKDIRFSLKDLEKVKILGGSELVKDMVVVSKKESEIQVLDPDNLKTVDVILPSGFKIKDDFVRVLKHNEDYFVVD
jgi:nonsense-mediated mRNA decay protein 3